MKKKAKGMGEVLDLLKTHPDLVHALVFNPGKVKRLLRSKAARRLVPGVNTRSLLKRVAGAGDGAPIAVCLSKTAHLCYNGTRCAYLTRLDCLGGTRPA
jgi:hypothetical protein